MQTSLHILALTEQLRQEIIGARIISTEFYKKERSAFLFLKKDKSKLALGFVYHPAGFGAYLVPASKVKIETREKLWPFFDLIDGTIIGVTQIGLDRIIELTIEKDKKTVRVMMEIIGPNSNLWLLDEDHRKQASLRKRTFDVGDEYAPKPLPNKIDPRTFSSQKVNSHLIENNQSRLSTLLERDLLGFNRALAYEAIHRAGLDNDLAEQLSADDSQKLAGAVGEIVHLFANSENAYLYDASGNPQAYPFKLRGSEMQPLKFKTLSLAVMEICHLRKTGAEFVDEEKRIKDAVARALKRLVKRRKKVEADIVEAADFEKYRKIAELLQIQFNQIKKGMQSIDLNDVFCDPPITMTVKLDPALSPNKNIESYAKRYRKGRDGHDLLARRLEITGHEIAHLEEIVDALDANFEAAQKRYDPELKSLLPKEFTRREAMPRLPYREYQLSTGLTIFIGRDGSDNDRTTFEFARPYELWFHTQQCPGSHVVIKYPNKSFSPSKREIEETAAIAAFHSKARHDSLVPVIYTERRYVRKPRKAKPGLVMVDREKSIMVKPTAPDKS